MKQTPYSGAAVEKTITYVGGLFERHAVPGQADELVHYIRAGATVAVFTKVDDGSAATDRTRWLHRDHLGSVDTVTDEAGLVAERRSYDAWGKPRNADWTVPGAAPALLETPRGFTGHEHLPAIGLIHMNGRVYDPTLGRMLSADPFVPHPFSTQSFNRYSYVINNPLAFTDPSGFHDEKSEFPGDAGGHGNPKTTNPHDPSDQSANDGGGYTGNPRDGTEGGGDGNGFGGAGDGTGSGNEMGIDNGGSSVFDGPGAGGEDFSGDVRIGASVAVANALYDDFRMMTEVPLPQNPLRPMIMIARATGVMENPLPDTLIAMPPMEERSLGMRLGWLGANYAMLFSPTPLGKRRAATQAVEEVSVLVRHKNSLSYVGETHVYAIRGPNGFYKIGESAQGVRVIDRASKRAEQQVRKLRRTSNQFYKSEIRKVFPDKRSARAYETRLIERYRRMYGDDMLPGNLTNR